MSDKKFQHHVSTCSLPDSGSCFHFSSGFSTGESVAFWYGFRAMQFLYSCIYDTAQCGLHVCPVQNLFTLFSHCAESFCKIYAMSWVYISLIPSICCVAMHFSSFRMCIRCACLILQPVASFEPVPIRARTHSVHKNCDDY